MDQKVDAIKKRRATGKLWARLRLGTSIGALLLIATSAWWKFELGTFSAVRVGPITIACPLGVAQVLAASQAFMPALALAGLGGFLLIVLFGRAFCGWLCPGRWILNRGPWQSSKSWPVHPWIPSAITGGLIGLSAVVHTPVFCPICPAGVVCRGAIAAGTGGSLLPTFGWLSAVMGFEWLSKRSWCRDLCPRGAVEIEMFARP